MSTRKRISPAKYIWLVAPLAAVLLLSGCPSNSKKVKAARGPQGSGVSTEPDKVLYQRALDNIQHNRYDQGRLDLQTLINTYPDSEYLAKAKLATADSYYKQGGPASLTQAIAEYQDFITFFPFLDEASYAQMQIAMAHYKRMEKPDRDRAEALEAEGAFQTFLQKYPSSPLIKDGQQRLREVQEVLAEGDYAVARFYFLRSADRASAARLYDLVSRYPLFSEADRANWMLATIAQRGEHNDIAGTFYARIVKDYPLSPLAGEAKDQLVKFGVPVPQADPSAMTRMQAEQQMPRAREKGGLLRTPEGMFRSSPDVRMAARIGEPTMTPENSTTGDTLNPGGGNLSVGVAGAGRTSTTSAPAAAGAGNGAIVETVVPGSAPAASGAAAAPAPDATATVSTPPAADAATGSDSSAAGSAASGDSTASGTAATTAQSTPATSDTPQNSSSSKKKKGLKKILPF